jgi:error-prone DNA polymerase
VDVPLPRTKSAQAVAARSGVPDPRGHQLVVLARDPAGYAALSRVISRAQLAGGFEGRPQYDWDELAAATPGAFTSHGLSRGDALWAAGPAAANRPGQLAVTPHVGQPTLPIMTTPEEMAADLWVTGISRTYPTQLLREHLNERGITPRGCPPSRTTHASPSPASSPTANAPAAPTASPSSSSKTKPASSTSSAPYPSGPATTAPRATPPPSLSAACSNAHGVTNVLAERIERLPLTMGAMSQDFQ